MWGSTIPSDHFGFYCDPHLQKSYKLVVIHSHLFVLVFIGGISSDQPCEEEVLWEITYCDCFSTPNVGQHISYVTIRGTEQWIALLCL